MPESKVFVAVTLLHWRPIHVHTKIAVSRFASRS